MQFTVTTTSQTLTEILSAWQESQLEANKLDTYKIRIQNLGANTIYIEKWVDAVDLTGYKLIQNDTIDLECDSLDDINLIANTGSNITVNILQL